MTIGDRIKALREAKGMTQIELADMTGTTKQTIYKYETGIVTNIPSDRIESIAKVLNVSPAYLMGWTDNPAPQSDGEIFKELTLKELREKLKIAPDDEAKRYNELLTIYLNTISQKFNQTLSAAEKEWLTTLRQMTQESLDKLQEQAELLLLAQQARADKEVK